MWRSAARSGGCSATSGRVFGMSSRAPLPMSPDSIASGSLRNVASNSARVLPSNELRVFAVIPSGPPALFRFKGAMLAATSGHPCRSGPLVSLQSVHVAYQHLLRPPSASAPVQSRAGATPACTMPLSRLCQHEIIPRRLRGALLHRSCNVALSGAWSLLTGGRMSSTRVTALRQRQGISTTILIC